MTTGNYSFTSPDQTLYSMKQWSGGNDVTRKHDNAYEVTSIRKTREVTYRYFNGALYDSVIWFDSTNWWPSDAEFWTSNDALDFMSKLSEKIREGSLNAAVAAAELPEAIDGVLAASKSIFKALNRTVRGDIPGAARALSCFSGQKPLKGRLTTQHISSAWLSLKYGWEPLISDVYAGMEWIHNHTYDRKLVFQHRTTKRKNVNSSTSPLRDIVPTEGIYSVQLKYTLKEPLSAARSLGLTNPALVLWEKVPYSFVVDWFIPVGNYLDALGFYPFLEGSYCSSVFRKGRSVGRSTTSYKPPAGWSYIWGDGVKYEAVRFSRSVGTSLQVPKPTFKTVSQAFSLPHIQNASALIWNLIGSVKR